VEGLVETHSQAVSLLRELQTGLARQADRIELDPGRLLELEERLNLLQSLKRKYGGSVEEVLRFGAEASERLAGLEGRDGELERLRTAIAAEDRAIQDAGLALSAGRRALLPRLDAAVCQELRSLGFRQSRFEVYMTTSEPEGAPDPGGFDRVEFQFAPNPGEPGRPLRAIASSGELARVMLAVKTVLADQDEVPVLVFDEVDANVGGETAHAVGSSMARIAGRHQVLCITHLAPVAAQASSHQVVSKEVRGGRTESRIAPVEGEERVEELARMLGGGEAARTHAAELLRMATDRRRAKA
jgi:DNA repair protein RecN (Recombination protein N)